PDGGPDTSGGRHLERKMIAQVEAPILRRIDTCK
ncbi:MAG: hypothetical protein ACJAXX_000196, partial [Roseivirga sp.]